MNLSRNSSLLFGARLSAQGLSILFNAVLARRLGVQDFGQFAFIASMIFIANTYTNFGTDTLLVRNTARSEQITDNVSRFLALQLTLSAIFCIAILPLRNFPLILYSFALFPLSIFSINNALLRAFARFDLFWLLSLVNACLQLFAALISKDILTLCIVLLFGQVFISFFSYRLCLASLSNYRLLPLKSFNFIFKLTLPFAALTILLVLIQRIGILVTSHILGDVDTGYFSSVVRVVDGLKAGHYAILGALLPAISRGAEDSWKKFRKSFILLLTFSLIAAGGLLYFSTPLIQVIYGEAFLPASRQLPLFGWSLIPYTVSSFISYDLIARGFENTVVKSAFISLLGYVALYFLIIPVFGLRGAVVSALVGEIFQAVVFMSLYYQTPRLVKQVVSNDT